MKSETNPESFIGVEGGHISPFMGFGWIRLLFILLLFGSEVVQAQDKIDLSKLKATLADTLLKEKVTETHLAVLKGDLFSAFRISGMSELKKENFKNSEQFKELKAFMENQLILIRQKQYVVVIENPFEKNYNLSLGAFVAFFASNFKGDGDQPTPYGIKNKVDFSNLKFQMENSPSIAQKKDQFLIIPADKTQALEIEDHKSDFEVVIEFKLGDLKEINYDFYYFDGKKYETKSEVIQALNPKIILRKKLIPKSPAKT